MKIVRVDNYARETECEYVVCEKIYNMFYAQLIVKALNTNTKKADSDHFVLKNDDYIPWKGLEEFA